MEEHPVRKSWPAPLLYAVAGFVAFFHCLVLNQAYFANDLLNQYSHFRALVRSQILAGHFPLWNPYFFGGQPFFADPNVMMAYPLNYLTLLFPIAYGLGVFYFLHFFIAAWGMHFWLKGLRLSENACRLGALLFSLSGFFWWELIHPPILAAFAWLPWWMGALARLSQEWAPSKAFGAGLAFAMIFTSGNFQMTSYFLYLGLAYFLLLLLLPGEKETGFRGIPWKKFPLVLLFGAWGGVILLVHMIPAYEFSKYTNRDSANQTYDTFNAYFSMKPETSYTLLFPSLGLKEGQTAEQAIQYFDQKTIDNDYYGMFGYLGIWAPFLVYMAFRRKDRKILWGLLGLAVLCLMVAWGKNIPLHRILCAVLPGINLSRAPFRAIGGTVACLCVLAAIGFQSLEKALAGAEKISTPLIVAFGGAGILFLVGCLNASYDWRELFSLLLGSLGLALWALTDSWKKLGRWVFLTALILPLFLSGWGDFNWGPASNYDFETNFPALTSLKTNAKDGRYFIDCHNGRDLPYPVRMGNQTYRWHFPEDVPMQLGIRDSGGYNPIYLLDPHSLQTTPLPTYTKLMAIKGFVLGSDTNDFKGYIRQDLSGAYYFGALNPPPFLNAPYQYLVDSNSQNALNMMKAPTFDPAQTIVLSSNLPDPVKNQLPGKPAALKYAWAKDEMDSQAFQVNLDQNSLVTVSEIVFPGWKAWIDGKPAEILRGDVALRALFVPAGSHLLEFRYEPAWALPLLVLAILWFLSLVAYSAYLWRQRKKNSLGPSHA
jgi:hypothetical protein